MTYNSHPLEKAQIVYTTSRGFQSPACHTWLNLSWLALAIFHFNENRA